MNNLKPELFALIKIIGRYRELADENPFLMNLNNVQQCYINYVWYRNNKKIIYYKVVKFLPTIIKKIEDGIYRVELMKQTFNREGKILIRKLQNLKEQFSIDDFTVRKDYHGINLWFLNFYFARFRQADFLHTLSRELFIALCRVIQWHDSFTKAHHTMKMYFDAIYKWVSLTRKKVETHHCAHNFRTILKSFEICI